MSAQHAGRGRLLVWMGSQLAWSTLCKWSAVQVAVKAAASSRRRSDGAALWPLTSGGAVSGGLVPGAVDAGGDVCTTTGQREAVGMD